MKKFLPLFIVFFISCSYGASGELDDESLRVVVNSASAISDTSATTATLPFRIVELVEETKNSSGGFTEAYVKWNAGHAFDNTTGI